ncbi:MAG: type II toxin-antitoxin system RelE/ParE family toxin [Bacillota bacterium]
MGNYSVELLPAAYDDLDEIFDYILLDSPITARKTLDHIINSLRRLEDFPYSGVRVTDKSLRHFSIRMVIIEPYVAFYRFINNKVYVYRILHGARDYVNLIKGQPLTFSD